MKDKQCVRCAEAIKGEAVACRFCGMPQPVKASALHQVLNGFVLASKAADRLVIGLVKMVFWIVVFGACLTVCMAAR
jgi:hypothetical protein